MINPTPSDVSLLLSLNGDAGATLDFVMYYASAKLTWIPLYALLLWAVWKKEGVQNLIRFVVIVAVAILIADQTANLFKTYLPKLRPTHSADLQGSIHIVYGYLGGLYGTVSSHAANAVVLTILCGSVLKRRWIWVAMSSWALLLCYSRIYLAVHYPYDVLSGIILGLVVGFGAAWTYKKWKNQWKK